MTVIMWVDNISIYTILIQYQDILEHTILISNSVTIILCIYTFSHNPSIIRL